MSLRMTGPCESLVPTAGFSNATLMGCQISFERKPTEVVAAPDLRRGNVVLCLPGDVIPSDGEVVEGVASVDESAITGESAPVVRESGGDRSAATGGTKVLSDFLVIKTGVEFDDLADRAQLSSLPDETPEGRSIVVLAKEKFGLRSREAVGMDFVPFSQDGGRKSSSSRSDNGTG